MDHYADRDQKCRLERLITKATTKLNPSPNPASLLAPYVDYFGIREEVSSDGNLCVLWFGSRRTIDLGASKLQARRVILGC